MIHTVGCSIYGVLTVWEKLFALSPQRLFSHCIISPNVGTEYDDAL